MIINQAIPGKHSVPVSSLIGRVISVPQIDSLFRSPQWVFGPKNETAFEELRISPHEKIPKGTQCYLNEAAGAADAARA